MSKAVFILGGARTPMTQHVGALKDLSAIELGAVAAKGAFARTGTSPEWIDHVVTTVGLVLLYQNTTGRWESWAYAWALVGPAASGARAEPGRIQRESVLGRGFCRIAAQGGRSGDCPGSDLRQRAAGCDACAPIGVGCKTARVVRMGCRP